MGLRLIVFLMLLPFVVACGGGGDGSSSAESSSGRSGGSAGGAKWRVEYSGDLEGEVSGSILSAAGIASTMTVAGGALNDERTGAAERSIRVTITRYGEEPPSATVTLNLDDGTNCQDVTQQDPQPSSVDIMDPEGRTFRADLEGTLHCGPERDQRIDFTAYLNADP